MIIKIISGGQTGADLAALDAAIKMNIPHGGWIPKGRLTEEGPLPDKYDLKEMHTDSFPERTEQNVMESNGTVIITHGPLTGGSLYTQEMAIKHNMLCLHIDLNKTSAFDAAVKINGWISEYEVDILNVAGSRASKDPKIYKAVNDIIEAVILLNTMDYSTAGLDSPLAVPPQSVNEAVERLLFEMTLKEKAIIAKINKPDLSYLKLNLVAYVRDKFRIWDGNKELMDSCRKAAGVDDITEDDASAVIVKELWQRLKESHGLRLVK